MMQSAVGREVYNPWMGWQGQMPGVQQYAQPAIYPAMYPQTYQQAYVPQVAPVVMQQPVFQQQAMPLPVVQQQAMPMPSSVSSPPPHRKPARKARSEQPEPLSKPKRVAKEGPKVRKTDYIHIVDDYPPIVKEAIKKAAWPPKPASTSSTSSTSTEPAEEVPRTTIPQAAPRFTEPPAFQFPQFPDLTSRAWEPLAGYPQFGVGGETKQPRYASPYIRRMPMHVKIDRRGHYPSNSPPECSEDMG
jgi:hypothetical protein